MTHQSNNMPKVSIIIPIYNAERYIEECLDSICKQTFSDFEVIMIDDGSKDRSAEVCQRYAACDSRLRYIYKENGGVSSARNRGIEVAQGEYVSFVDADDWVTEDYLETLMASEPKADITFFGETTIESNGGQSQRIPKDTYCKGQTDIEEILYYLKCGPLGDIMGWTWDKFFRLDIINEHKIRFREDLCFMEDEVFTLEYCHHIGSIRTISSPLYFYRKLDSGLTKQGFRQNELLALSACMLNEMKHFSHEGLCECLLKDATDFHAKYVHGLSLGELKDGLMAYRDMTRLYPQPGKRYRVNHLTNYLKHGIWGGYLYWIIKKL